MDSCDFSATIMFCVCNQLRNMGITSLHLNAKYVHSREYLIGTPGNVHNYLILTYIRHQVVSNAGISNGDIVGQRSGRNRLGQKMVLSECQPQLVSGKPNISDRSIYLRTNALPRTLAYL